MKKWLFTCDEDGLSNFDVITGWVTVSLAFIIPVILVKLFGAC